MMTFTLIYAGYALLIAGIAALIWKQSGVWQRALAYGMIMLFFPVGGILLVWVLHAYRADQLREVPDLDVPSNHPDNPAGNVAKPLNIWSETNVAPLEDILLVADYDRRRETLLDLLKSDVLANAGYVQIALHNDDTETVHYAASGLQYARQKLDSRLHELSRRHQADPDNPQIAEAYADLLEQYLSSFHLDTATRQKYLQLSIEILSRIVRPPDMTRIRRLIENLIAVNQYHEASHYCGRLMTEYPDSEGKYLILLKSFFMMKDKASFEQTFTRFRDSDITISDDALNIIRLWMGAVK